MWQCFLQKVTICQLSHWKEAYVCPLLNPGGLVTDLKPTEIIRDDAAWLPRLSQKKQCNFAMWVGTLTLGTLSQSLRIPTTWGHRARRKAPVRLTIIGAIAPMFHDTWKYRAALLKSQLTNVESGLETRCLDHRPKRAFSAVTSIRLLPYGLNRHRCHKGCSGLWQRDGRGT